MVRPCGFPAGGSAAKPAKAERGLRATAGVLFGYARRYGQALVDRRLYLPKEWAKDAIPPNGLGGTNH